MSAPKLHSERGVSAVEVSIGTGLAAVLSLAMIGVARTTDRGHQELRSAARAEEALRCATQEVGDVLTGAAAGRIEVTTDAKGNSVLEAQSVVAYADGAPVWGIDQRVLGSADSDRVRVGWRQRIRLRTGATSHLEQLLLDETGNVRKQRDLVDGVTAFAIAKPTGAAVNWKVRLTVVGRDGRRQSLSFDVVPRN